MTEPHRYQFSSTVPGKIRDAAGVVHQTRHCSTSMLSCETVCEGVWMDLEPLRLVSGAEPVTCMVCAAQVPPSTQDLMRGFMVGAKAMIDKMRKKKRG